VGVLFAAETPFDDLESVGYNVFVLCKELVHAIEQPREHVFVKLPINFRRHQALVG